MTQMRTIGTSQVSDYNSRIVELQVTGVCRQDVKRVSAYTIKVPYNRMSQTMQEIHRLGGKVTGVVSYSTPQTNDG